MKILIVGNGGREHALAYKAAQSPLAKEIFIAPGNAGTASEPKCQNLSIAADDITQLLSFAQEQQIDLTIVGPEAPLSAGIVDQFNEAGLLCFGPVQAAAQLESSKSFCKDFLCKYNIPTAQYAVFEQVTPALSYLEEQALPIVIKADGLAAGKGVFICNEHAQAVDAIKYILEEDGFGQAGNKVVIEQFLTGEEASFIVLVDDQTVVPLATSQDHKARYEGDTGPNTGGMGAYSPAPIVDQQLHEKIMSQIIKPTLAGLKEEGICYQGFLYAGLMIDHNNNPFVLEYNCRLGDPETQVLLYRLQSDLVELCLTTAENKLTEQPIAFDKRPALTVVMAADGYPGSYQKGEPITGLDQIKSNDIKVFHAGTKNTNNQVLTNGGRVLAVTAIADTLKQAQSSVYAALRDINWPSAVYRNDIGHKALKNL